MIAHPHGVEAEAFALDRDLDDVARGTDVGAIVWKRNTDPHEA